MECNGLESRCWLFHDQHRLFTAVRRLECRTDQKSGAGEGGESIRLGFED